MNDVHLKQYLIAHQPAALLHVSIGVHAKWLDLNSYEKNLGMSLYLHDWGP
jgi:hypothetical protein